MFVEIYCAPNHVMEMVVLVLKGTFRLLQKLHDIYVSQHCTRM